MQLDSYRANHPSYVYINHSPTTVTILFQVASARGWSRDTTATSHDQVSESLLRLGLVPRPSHALPFKSFPIWPWKRTQRRLRKTSPPTYYTQNVEPAIPPKPSSPYFKGIPAGPVTGNLAAVMLECLSGWIQRRMYSTRFLQPLVGRQHGKSLGLLQGESLLELESSSQGSSFLKFFSQAIMESMSLTRLRGIGASLGHTH